MAKLTDIHIVKLFDDQRIDFDTPVNVTKEGLFTTTLPQHVAEKIETYGLKLRTTRVGRAGYFSSDTLEGLKDEILKFLDEATSKTLIEEKLVIKYQIHTRCSYVLDADKEIIPNGYWRKGVTTFGYGDPNFYNTNWRDGNKNEPAYHGNTPSISVFARVFHKRIYAYKSGKTIEVLEPYKPKDKRGDSIDWINSVVDIIPERKGFISNDYYTQFPEVDATEENAAMFVKLFKFIFQANEVFHDMNNPEYMLKLIANNQVPIIDTKE